MARVSPIVRSFNAGEFSELMEGRTDLERYPASMRKMRNAIAAPQGPIIGRSGTAMVTPIYDSASRSVLVPFIFSNENFTLLEFAEGRVRFVSEGGLLVYAPVAGTTTSTTPFKINSATLAAEVGDEVALGGFPANYNLNGETVKVINKVGNEYTFNRNFPALSTVNGTAARVYHILHPLSFAERDALRAIQSVDIVYLLTGLSVPLKLSRYGTYDWRLAEVDFKDGPYMPVNETGTTLTPNATGAAFAALSSNAGPGGTAAASGNRPFVDGVDTGTDWLNRQVYNDLAASQSFYAFDSNDDTYWAGDAVQQGWVEYTPTVPRAIAGYTIYAARDNQDTEYTADDYAPSTFKLEGLLSGTYHVLDSQENYVLYQNSKSGFFEVTDHRAFEKFRLTVIKNKRNGAIEARIRQLTFKSYPTSDITLTASSTIGINKDTGFQATDVGRTLRYKGRDNSWREMKIIAVHSTTVVDVNVRGEPLPDTRSITQWRLGYWSNTTGWPGCGDFFDDRLWLAGATEFPDVIAGSMIGIYEKFSQTDDFGAVLDDNAVVFRLNARKLSRIRWLTTDERGLLIGTGSDEYVLSSASPQNEAITAKSVKAKGSTRRGSADVEPVKVDRQVLYVQRSGRTVREFAYSYEADGYKSPSMSQLASHLGISRFVEMDYAAEPHSLVWLRRQDGMMIGLTYNRDENVVGWHRHDFSGAVESMAVVPQLDQAQDALWIIVNRTINGSVKRYIERLTPFWDFDTIIEEAHYVDSGLRYQGVEATVFYGMQHLEGEEVYGLADGKPVGPHTVTNGAVTIPFPAANVVLGLGFESEGETSRLDNGASDQGTSMGKQKRINQVIANVWASACGQFGTWSNDTKQFVYQDIEFPKDDYTEIDLQDLYTGDIPPIVLQPGFDTRGSVAFRRPKETPLPFNIIAIMPKMVTHDG